MTQATEPPIRIERDGPAFLITFTRPSVLNAINREVGGALVAALADFERSDASMAVLCGDGDEAFSVGADLKEAGRVRGKAQTTPDSVVLAWIESISECPKPVIAAVDGYCLGLGYEFAVAADMRIATRRSTFGLPEARLGMLGGPSLFVLQSLMPTGEALRLTLTGAPMSAERAYQIGFVQGLVGHHDELLALARSIADDVAAAAPRSVRLIKQIVNRRVRDSASQALMNEIRPLLADTPDADEGLRAFQERRRPAWRSQ